MDGFARQFAELEDRFVDYAVAGLKSLLATPEDLGVLLGIALLERIQSSSFNWIVLGLLAADTLLLFTGEG